MPDEKDDESALVHGILTADNLFDGTITTKFEHYYIEPSSKYSKDLHGNGVHSIVYKLAEIQNPPLPLDLDVPYNDDFNVYSPKHDDDTNGEDMTFPNSKNHLNRKNILINDYNPDSDFNLRDIHRNRNIIINNFDNTNSSRPSHKTHVEIITKNGATKKPNIIVNNYNPDVILTSTNFHHNTIHQHVRNDIIDGSSKSSYDRKITCMLYLQADHTFFQKMGSDEASIEAITRHVQRANFIYKNTDFNGDGKPDNITFMIKRIKVHNLNALKDPAYRFPGNYGVEKFLELFSDIKHAIKMPKMQKVKESGNAFFNKFSLNIFGISKSSSTPPARITIQTTHISTISSLVDKTKIGTFTYDTKRENYGLYALKCNRNAFKQGLLMNINSELNYQMPIPTSSTISTPSNDVSHEVFSPCDNNDGVENNLNSIDQYHEYYKIEFSEERGLRETSNIDKNANFPNNSRRMECNVNNKRMPPPRHKKKLLSNTTSTVNDKGTISTKPISTERLLKNCQKNNLSSGCWNEQQLSGSGDNGSRKLSKGENELSRSIGKDMDFKKNHSELYRIVQTEERIRNVDFNHTKFQRPANQINSKVTTRQRSSFDSGKSYLV